jgi:glutamine amidotransferase
VLTLKTENWVNVPTNSILTIHNQTVMVHPIADRYYHRNPHHSRSTAYVQTKGLAANEKSAAVRDGTPMATPMADLDIQKRYLGPLIPFSPAARSRTPEVSSIPRSKTPLSFAESTASTLAVRPPPPPVANMIRSTSQPPPAQGNIKRKRASISAMEINIGEVASSTTEVEPHSPVAEDTRRSEFGNPTKLARFFPELAL